MRTALLTRLASVGTLPDTDALLLLTHYDPGDPAASPAGNGLVTTSLYIGSKFDDTRVWARAGKFCAQQVLFVPGDDDKLIALLTQHLGVHK